jgi:hypothetical protein
VIESPSEQDIRHAMTRALEVRIRRYLDQDYTASALQERVTALPGRPEHLGSDWWRVGQIIDTIAGVELAVECRPPRLRLTDMPSRYIAPSPPSFIADDAEPIGPARYWQKPPGRRDESV